MKAAASSGGVSVKLKNMYLSYNLLKKFCDIRVSPDELGRLLTVHSFEVEEVKPIGNDLKGVVVGEVLQAEKHPNADRLKICLVDVGKKNGGRLTIVCGAPNVEPGQKVPVALVGTTMPGGLKMESREVRGVRSSGMICAPDELGLGDGHEGIMVLNSDFKVGTPLSQVLGLKDFIIEVDNKSITNRPDLWGHLGVAREISAILKSSLKFGVKKIKSSSVGKKIKVEIEDYKLCPRYSGIVIENVKVAPSPVWLQAKLQSLGLRPINNIVDITNYVMAEIGQPMHAFDLNKLVLSGDEIKIGARRARKGEKILALDKETYKLEESDLVIADQKGPVAIAGIMGGLNAGVTEKTAAVVLESANFHPINIRKTSARLHLRSDSSMRNEKGLDPNLTEIALARAVEMILEIVPGAKVGRVSDKKKFKLFVGPIKISLEEINRKTGIDISKKDVSEILKRLGFGFTEKGGVFTVKVPSWRGTGDIEIPEDIIEEAVRIYGYGNIKPKFPLAEIREVEVGSEKIILEKTRDILSRNLGLTEVYNYSFNGDNQLKKLGIKFENYIKLKNPASAEQNLMRQSLLPNLLGNVLENVHNYEEFFLFEIGSAYLSEREGYKKTIEGKEFLPKQDKFVSGVFVFDAAGKNKEEIFYNIKENINLFLSELKIADFGFKPHEGNREISELFHPAKSVLVEVDGGQIGILGELHPKVKNKISDKKKIGIFELNLSKISKAKKQENKYKELPRFPRVERDLSFVLDRKIVYNDIVTEIKSISDLIKDISLFDIYEDEKNIGQGKKSLAFHIEFSSGERTLKAEEVDVIFKNIVGSLERKFKAEIRR